MANGSLTPSRRWMAAWDGAPELQAYERSRIGELAALESGWHTAEVISSPYHLPRTALILARYPKLRCETHAAHWPAEYSLERRLQLDWREAVGSFRIRIHGFRKSKYLPD